MKSEDLIRAGAILLFAALLGACDPQPTPTPTPTPTISPTPNPSPNPSPTATALCFAPIPIPSVGDYIYLDTSTPKWLENIVSAEDLLGHDKCWGIGQESEGLETLAKALRDTGLCASANEDRVLVLRKTAVDVERLIDATGVWPEDTAGLEAEEYHAIRYADDCRGWADVPYKGVLIWQPRE